MDYAAEANHLLIEEFLDPNPPTGPTEHSLCRLHHICTLEHIERLVLLRIGLNQVYDAFRPALAYSTRQCYCWCIYRPRFHHMKPSNMRCYMYESFHGILSFWQC